MAGKWSFKEALLRNLYSAFAPAIVIPLLCLEFFRCGKARYRKVRGQWAWVGRNVNGRSEAILNADTKSFVILGDRKYAKDHERVFFESQPILDADPASFEILPYEVGAWGRVYSKDRFHVYLEENQIAGADPESFAMIGAPYARDRSRVYCGTVPMEGSDPETFHIMLLSHRWHSTPNKEHFVRFNGPAFADLEISESRPARTTSGSWAKDANHHYRDAARVIGADYDTFHATNNILGGADKDHEYYGPLREDEFDRVVKREVQ